MKSKTALKTEQTKSISPSTDKTQYASFSFDDRTVALNYDIHELDQKVKSMMHKSQHMMQSGEKMTKVAICNVCGKEGHPRNISDHIESNHLEGISIP